MLLVLSFINYYLDCSSIIPTVSWPSILSFSTSLSSSKSDPFWYAPQFCQNEFSKKRKVWLQCFIGTSLLSYFQNNISCIIYIVFHDGSYAIFISFIIPSFLLNIAAIWTSCNPLNVLHFLRTSVYFPTLTFLITALFPHLPLLQPFLFQLMLTMYQKTLYIYIFIEYIAQVIFIIMFMGLLPFYYPFNFSRSEAIF